METAVCCIAKNENNYIREFVEHYKKLGFSNVIIYDNNDIEDINDPIGDYIKEEYAIIINARVKVDYQINAYNDCMKKFYEQYDWIAFFDCDEFLCLNKFENINDYINSFDKDVDCICINWMQMTDNGMAYNDGRKLMERFIEPMEKYSYVHYPNIYENAHIKSIVKCSRNVRFTSSHFALNCHKYADADGNDVTKYQPNFHINNEIHWDNAYLKHFSQKTISELLYNKILKWNFKFKMKNNNFYNTKKDMVDIFFRINKHTPEKDKIVEEFFKKQNN